MSKKIRIALAQINPVVGDLGYNKGIILHAVSEARSGTDLIVFPELCLCGYPPEDLLLKPRFLDDVKETTKEIVRESQNWDVHILLSVPWLDDGKLYNAIHLIGDGRIQATRYKHKLPTYGVFDEDRLFEAGPLPEPIPFRGIQLGVMICEDMWYPDVSRHLKSRGAEILIISNASPYDQNKYETRLDLAQQRVADTKLPLVFVNQVGGQDELVFDGASFAINQKGHVILQAEQFETAVHSSVWEKTEGSDIWLCEAESFTPLMSRREHIYSALLMGLRDYVTKNGFSHVLIGLSGGIDSALVAAIAVDALGADAVQCVMMPSEYTSQDSFDDAAETARALGVPYHTVPITVPVEAYNEVLRTHIPDDAPSITFENIQSRCRGIMLMALSNASNALVLSTGNKSEMAVGYATLYGDMCGAFNPLKDVYKTLVYDLVRWRNQNKPLHGFGPGTRVIPERILTKAPTAELKPDQTDQDSLPPYDELDGILECLIECDLSVEETISKGYEMDTVKRVSKMLRMAEYKRRQAPPGTKITTKSFGRDRRYPITNKT